MCVDVCDHRVAGSIPAAETFSERVGPIIPRSSVRSWHLAAFRLRIRCRPVVRIPGLHPGDPGSNPGGGGLATVEPELKSAKAQTAGFEPAHAEHTRLAGEPRNHLGTSAMHGEGRRRGRPARRLSHGVVVSTQDPESCDRGSNPRGRSFAP